MAITTGYRIGALNMVEQVKQEILAAFSSLKTPKPRGLLGPSTGDKTGERQIQKDLAGKHWMDLDAKFLKGRWSSFCYLSAEGYRYYLPALLMRCLEDFSAENDLIHSTMFNLAPSYWSLYYQGADDHFQYQTSLFSAEQYRAVCSFLGLVFDSLPHLDFLSAKALKWGWNRYEHAALSKCQEFYSALHHYQYPVSDEPQVKNLIEQIKTAFDTTPYPGDDRLCGSDQGDEPAEYALEFRGLNWRTIHPDFLAQHHASLSFFSTEGFRYFLPAYLIADLMGTDSNANPVFHLTHGLCPDYSLQAELDMKASGLLSDELVALMEEEDRMDTFDWHQIAVDKFSHFNHQEREAIISYLQYSTSDEYSRDEINEALEKYWLKTPS
jgi:hypothetical protein